MWSRVAAGGANLRRMANANEDSEDTRLTRGVVRSVMAESRVAAITRQEAGAASSALADDEDSEDEMVRELDKRVLEFGGRLYTAKDSRTTAETFHSMYPRIDEWIKVRRSVDPTGVFASDMARRLELL